MANGMLDAAWTPGLIGGHVGETLRVTLTAGQFALVDEIDADLASLKWQADPWKQTPGFYAKRACRGEGGRQVTSLMHRVVLGRVLGRPLKRSEWVDHRDRNGLNNTRGNLRLATPSQNDCNRSASARSSSGFKGVFFDKATMRWMAQIAMNRKQRTIGRFHSVIEAAVAYDRACYELHGEFANANFPRHAVGAQ